jgi:iduronate 2-sulfatase
LKNKIKTNMSLLLLLNPTNIIQIWMITITLFKMIHAQQPPPPPPPNVLMIMIDDLKPVVGAFGDPFVSTPTLDDLTKRGLRFDNHHVQVAECAPSRVSFLSGLRPDFIENFSREGNFRIKNPYVKTLPGYLRKNGYHTVAVGKVFDWPAFTATESAEQHPLEQCPSSSSAAAADASSKSTKNDPPPPPPECSFDLHIPPFIAHLDTCICKNLRNVPYPPNGPGNADVNQFHQPLVWGENTPEFTNAMGYDSCHVNHGIDQMRKLTDLGKPWFLAVGIFRPQYVLHIKIPLILFKEKTHKLTHTYMYICNNLLNIFSLPWVNPESYYDMYGDGKEIADAVLGAGLTRQFFFTQANVAGLYDSQEIYDYIGPPGWAPQFEVSAQRRVRAYYASVSYGDAEMGRLIRGLQDLPGGTGDNTLVVVWSDNGFHLGPGIWGKKTVYEDATRVPLIIVPPKTWIKKYGGTNGVLLKGIGSSTVSPVESIDVYPTVLDILGFPSSVALDDLHLHGTSLVPLLFDPSKMVKEAAMSQYHSWLNAETKMAYTLRSKDYRLIIYYAFDR